MTAGYAAQRYGPVDYGVSMAIAMELGPLMMIEMDPQATFAQGASIALQLVAMDEMMMMLMMVTSPAHSYKGCSDPFPTG